MSIVTQSLRAGRWVLVTAAAAVAGCVFTPPGPIVAPEPAEPVVVAPSPSPSAAPAVSPVQPAASRPPVPDPRRDIAVLFDGASSDHAAVAAAAAELLEADGHRVMRIDTRADGALEPLAGRPNLLAVAVGFEAAARARRELAVPLVFCQVFNHHDVLDPERPIWGVEAMPPVRLQLEVWKALNPALASVAVIVGEPHAALAQAAVEAGRELGIAVSYAVAASDRETSYFFKRAAPRVDGVWLPPDGRILSPRVLRELLDYAVGHGIGVGVANDALLEWGALFSATGTAADVARTVRGIVGRVASGDARDLPALTPLSELELDVNATVAAALGLAPPADLPWVLRDSN